MTEPTSSTRLLVDGHVHLHACFELERFLAAAHRNFRSQGRGNGGEAAPVAVLLLAEMGGDSRFERLRDARPRAGAWSLRPTAEGDSLEAIAADGRLLLVAGRQLVTAEDLEVLAVGTERPLADGTSLADCVAAIREAGAVPVLPWGVGKWLGRRGALLADYLARDPGPDLWLGDNSGRPAFWGRPRHFALGTERGLRVLPGTDPLPFPRECERAGSFGGRAQVAFDATAPAAAIRGLLRDPGFAPTPYGRLERPLRFLRNQLAMQVSKRRA